MPATKPRVHALMGDTDGVDGNRRRAIVLTVRGNRLHDHQLGSVVIGMLDGGDDTAKDAR